jgi:hypothetical protein
MDIPGIDPGELRIENWRNNGHRNLVRGIQIQLSR